MIVACVGVRMASDRWMRTDVSSSKIPMYMIWFNAEGFLLGLRQEPEVAARAALYLRALSIGIPGYGINTIMKK